MALQQAPTTREGVMKYLTHLTKYGQTLASLTVSAHSCFTHWKLSLGVPILFRALAFSPSWEDFLSRIQTYVFTGNYQRLKRWHLFSATLKVDICYICLSLVHSLTSLILLFYPLDVGEKVDPRVSTLPQFLRELCL